MRPLSPEEYGIINALISHSECDREKLNRQLSSAKALELDDGGMGSLRLFYDGEESNKEFGEEVSALKGKDVDGVPMIFSLLLDRRGNLFELNVWKVDFSKTICLPNASTLVAEVAG